MVAKVHLLTVHVIKNKCKNCCRNLAVRGLRLLLLVGTIISVLVVFCIWQVLILAFLK